MKYKNKLNQIKAVLGIEIKLEQMKLDNGTVVEAEVFEAGNEIFIINGDERVALPIGEYTFEDGRLLSVTEEGIIWAIKEPGSEEAPAEEEAPELEADASPTTPKKIVESVSKEMHFSEEQKGEIKQMFADFKTELLTELKEVKEEPKKEELKKEEVKLEEVKPIVASPESNVEKKPVSLYSQNKKGVSMQDRVNQRILNYKQK